MMYYYFFLKVLNEGFKEVKESKVEQTVIDDDVGGEEEEVDAKQARSARNTLQNQLAEDGLASFLIKSAINDASITNYLYWYLKVEVCALLKISLALDYLKIHVTRLLTPIFTRSKQLRRWTLKCLRSIVVYWTYY